MYAGVKLAVVPAHGSKKIRGKHIRERDLKRKWRHMSAQYGWMDEGIVRSRRKAESYETDKAICQVSGDEQ